MMDLFQWLGTTPAAYLKHTFETSLIALFLACLTHSWWLHGPSRTIREFTAGFFLTAALENIGVLSGAYIYPGFTYYIYATPLLNPLSWVAVVYIVSGFTDRLLSKPDPILPCMRALFILAAIDASLLVMVDLIEDPLATIYNWWLWVPYAPGITHISPNTIDAYNFSGSAWLSTPDNPVLHFFAGFFPHGARYPTRIFGIPLINFIDWFLLVFSFSLALRWVESQTRWSEMRKTTVLWLCMPLIGALLIPTILLNL